MSDHVSPHHLAAADGTPTGENQYPSLSGHLFRLMPREAQLRLFGNIARNLAQSSREIQLREICHFFQADPAYGIGVADALGIDLNEFMPQGTELTSRRTELAAVS